MTREEATDVIKILQAYIDGKDIEYQHKIINSDKWRLIPKGINSYPFDFDTYQYRIKPESKYRPFKTLEECWNEMMKHQPFGWLKAKNSGNVILIGDVSMSKEVWIVWATDETESYSASKVFNGWVFADDTPFGIKED